jgi:hypothetical protein
VVRALEVDQLETDLFPTEVLLRAERHVQHDSAERVLLAPRGDAMEGRLAGLDEGLG